MLQESELDGPKIDKRLVQKRKNHRMHGTLILIDLGDFYRTHRKDYNRAYELYRRAQEHAPRDETAYRRLMDICTRLGKPGEAHAWSDRWKQAKTTKRNVGPRS